MSLMQSLKKSPAVLRRRLRRDRTEDLSHGDPLFKLQYLGSENVYSLDLEQARDAIGRLLEGAPSRPGKEHALVVRPRYVEVKELSTGRQLSKTFLQDIAYCTADTVHPNVFLYICKQRNRQLQCRVFWCSRAERAKELTACLAAAFQRALSDWQGDSSNRTQGEGPASGGFLDLSNQESRSAALLTHLAKGGSVEEAEPGFLLSSESEPEEGHPV
ncbi:low density lipoprotein receptor adapter protein 1-B-like [Paramormyrops kingsleyae]|uniref:low density lipoprotein receptor adapter protein 1-B-like n=1 Tax=Paramormyrops kingsleyae TaxID=1676925 RepID=UPI003B96DB0A